MDNKSDKEQERKDIGIQDITKTIGYTTGVFDVFHRGHLNILRNAKALCDKLIVGVSTDELVESKGKKAIVPFDERLEIVQAIKYVDLAIPQTTIDKIEEWKKLGFNRVFVGDDWFEHKEWDIYEAKLKPKGVEFYYFPYTKDVSSSVRRAVLSEIEQYLFDTIKYLEDMGLRTFLIGSTLLQLVRSSELKVRHIYDKELNLGCLDEELTDGMMEKISRDKVYSDMGGDNNRKRTIICFGDTDVNPQSPWEDPTGFTLLVPFFLKDDRRVEYTGNSNYCVSWPKYHLEKFETIDYKGHTLNVPSDYKSWLSHYFGLDWGIENLNWRWETGAKNIVLWNDLIK